MLSKSLNVDYSESGMRISNISPGAVKTNFANVRYKGVEQKAENDYKGYIPLEANDIANIISFVLEAPRHVNISEITVMPTTQRNFFK
jgi:NADP-dependent 3-hydroxy acid dehydrogenase YdfG